MGNIHSLSDEKKRTKTSRRRTFIKNALLKPTTWKAAAAALDFILKAVRVGTKIWDMFT